MDGIRINSRAISFFLGIFWLTSVQDRFNHDIKFSYHLEQSTQIQLALFYQKGY